MRVNVKNLAAITVIMTMMLCGVASGHSDWLQPNGGRPTVTLEIMKADVWNEGIKIGSTVWFLSGRFPINPNVVVLMDIPFVNYSYSPKLGWYDYWSEPSYKDNFLGNPYFGIEVQNAVQSTYFNIGCRLPVAKSDSYRSYEYAAITDFDRAEAFESDCLAARTRLGVRAPVSRQAKIHSYIGPTALIPSDERYDSELILDYGLQLWLETEAVRVGSGFSGRLMATGGCGSLAECTVHQFGIALDVGKGNFRPGFNLHLPLDDFAGPCCEHILKYSYGINLTYLI